QRPGEPFSAPGGKERCVGAASLAAHQLGDGNGGPASKTVSPVVAPAQFRRRLGGELGVFAWHSGSLPHVAGTLWDAVDDDGAGCRRGPSWIPGRSCC